LEWPIEEGKGIDDRLINVGPDRVLADIAGVQFGDWKTRLLRNEKGKLRSCYENVALYFEHHPAWVGVVGYNEFANRYVLLRDAPEPITAKAGQEIDTHFDTAATRWMERRGMNVNPDVIHRAITSVARGNCFHPVRDFLNGLPAWDGTP